MTPGAEGMFDNPDGSSPEEKGSSVARGEQPYLGRQDIEIKTKPYDRHIEEGKGQGNGQDAGNNPPDEHGPQIGAVTGDDALCAGG